MSESKYKVEGGLRERQGSEAARVGLRQGERGSGPTVCESSLQFSSLVSRCGCGGVVA